MGAGLLALGLFTASEARALAFTLQSPLVIDGTNNAGSGVFGTINPVLTTAGALGLTSGNTNFALTDVLIVDVTLNAGSASVGGIEFGDSGAIFGEPVGAGSFADVGDQAPSAVLHVPFDFIIGGVGQFTFLPNQLDANETSVRLFVTYSPGLVLNAGDTANFMISSGANFTVQGIIVPEPGTFLLLGGGLAVLGARGVRTRRRVR
ncbi:MAG: PEP-CTERM sorting domain-containing protein [Myxococcota bacterium]